MSSCGQCGADNAADAKFCNQCGAPLMAQPPRQSYTPRHLAERVLRHRSAMEGERKQVTVLFADMAGSTRIANELDAEEWHRILDEFFSILSEEIHRYEGTINQFTGDGVMALFGAPLALEDHAARAARAALALRERLREFADRLRLERGINPSTRMGLNSGEVVVGRIGDDLRMDYTAKGLTVNLAARMEQIAAPGSVYLTHDTADLIRDYFELRPLGPMQVKGREQPVPVFELTGQTAISLRLEASRARGLTGFAGRQRELQNLLQAMDQTGEGRQLRVLIGDGGLGKSRLCYEAAERWRQAGVPVLSCSGVPHGQSVPLQPVRDLVLQRFGVQPTDSPAQARQKIAGTVLLLQESLRAQLPLMFEFLGIADPQAGPLPLPPEVRDQRMRELFREVCLLESGQRRVILVEDLHWLDAGSQEFFRILLDCGGCQSSLLLFNMRPGPLPSWLAAHRPEQIVLQPLSSEAMAQMARSLIGQGEELDDLVRQITRQASGNPFYIEESVRSLVSEGLLQGEPGARRLTAPLHQIEIPASVQAIIAGRVDRLDPADKALLQAAAVLGQRFDYRLLRAVCELDETALQDALRRLELGNYLRGDDDSANDQWLFCHPLLQEVVYASLLRDRRIVLHRQVAGLLEKYFEETGSLRAAAGLAHHWEAAGEKERSAQWCIRCAALVAQQDIQEDIRYLRRALRLLDPVSDAGRPLAIQARASLLRLAGFHDLELDMDALYEEARQMAEELGDKGLLAELLISNGGRLLSRSDADRAVENTGEAMRLAQDLADASLESRFRIPILFSYFAAGRLDDGLQVLDRRDGGAWHQGTIDADNMMSRGFRALILAFRGQLELAEAEARAALACAEKLDVKVSWMYSNLIDIQLLRGRLGDGPELARRACDYAREFGSSTFIEIAERAAAQVAMAQGDPGAAVELLEHSRSLVAPDAIGAQFAAAHLGTLAQAYHELGRLEEARETVEEAIARGRAARQRVWTLRAWIRKARLLQDEERSLQECLGAMDALIRDTGAELFRGDWLQFRAVLARQEEDEGSAAQWWAQAQEHWRRCGAEARLSAQVACS